MNPSLSRRSFVFDSTAAAALSPTGAWAANEKRPTKAITYVVSFTPCGAKVRIE